MKERGVVFCLLVSMGLALNIFSEDTRIWEDQSGKQYEAEYVREIFDKVTLRMADGQEVRIAVENLSEHDQKYLRVMVPPELEIDVTTSSRPRSKQFDDQYDQDNDITTFLTATAEIRKKSKRPFTSRLTAELFLVAQEIQDRDYYILLSKTDSSFLLGDHNDGVHTFKTEAVTLMEYTEWDRQRRGPDYIGYVLTISDVNGDIVSVSTDIDWLADKVPELRELYTRGAASRYSRYFDKETVQKKRVPRPRDFAGRSI